MKRRFVLLFCLFLAGCLLSAADLKTQVCVVKPKMEQGIQTALLDLAKNLRNDKLDKLADFFESYAKGGFGSGFLVADEKGALFVITNRHVAALSTKADLEFSNNDGDPVIIPDCPVLYSDDGIDLAVIAVPSGAKLPGEPLQIYTGVLEDGMEVWSAGYPGLMNRPSWQLGKGVITNRKLTMPELSLTDGAWFIQHSATIDPGNSGGPLLVKEGSQYQVIGINFLSMSNRQNTFFSIPVKFVSTVLAKAKKATDLDAEGKLALFDPETKAVCQELTKDAFDQVNASRFVSYQNAAVSGWSDYILVSRSLSKDDEKTWNDRQRAGLPLELFRQSVWAHLSLSIQRSFKTPYEIKWEKILSKPSVENGMTGKIIYSVADQKFVLVWKWEAGHWRILSEDIGTITSPKAFKEEKENDFNKGSTSQSQDTNDDSEKQNIFYVSGLGGAALSDSYTDFTGGADAGLGYIDGITTQLFSLSAWMQNVHGKDSFGYPLSAFTGTIIGFSYKYQWKLGPEEWQSYPVIWLGLGAGFLLGAPSSSSSSYSGGFSFTLVPNVNGGLGWQWGGKGSKDLRFGAGLDFSAGLLFGAVSASWEKVQGKAWVIIPM